MKTTTLTLATLAVITASIKNSYAITAVKDNSITFQCPSPKAIKEACDSLGSIPLRCMSPSSGKKGCNMIQCNQGYINNYSICQCLHADDPKADNFKQSLDMELLINRCGVRDLINPFGNPFTTNSIQDTTASSPTDNLPTIDDPVPDVNSFPKASPTQQDDTADLNASAVTIQDDNIDDASAPNDSYNDDSTISVGAILGIVLGFGVFLLAATLVVMIIGSRYKQSHSDGPASSSSATSATRDMDGVSVIYEFSPPAEMSSVGHGNSPVIWDKVDHDFEMNGALPVYSDIMADGSSFSYNGLAPGYNQVNSDENELNNNTLDHNSRNNGRAA